MLQHKWPSWGLGLLQERVYMEANLYNQSPEKYLTGLYSFFTRQALRTEWSHSSNKNPFWASPKLWEFSST